MPMTMRNLEWVGVLFALLAAGATLTTGCSSDSLIGPLCVKAGQEPNELFGCCAGLEPKDTPAGPRCTAVSATKAGGMTAT